MAEQRTQLQDTLAQGGTGQDALYYDDAAVQEVAVDLRRRTGELKKKATTSTEKATIEIVALMFQSILAEERIPPAIRVWFARLQMPVLRVAIAEPEFFGSLEHPARQLIDRMGSCVMGFDAAAIGGSALETEIKRVVQVIEQYPETGRRVFQLVYDEFQKFLSKFLTEQGADPAPGHAWRSRWSRRRRWRSSTPSSCAACWPTCRCARRSASSCSRSGRKCWRSPRSRTDLSTRTRWR